MNYLFLEKEVSKENCMNYLFLEKEVSKENCMDYLFWKRSKQRKLHELSFFGKESKQKNFMDYFFQKRNTMPAMSEQSGQRHFASCSGTELMEVLRVIGILDRKVAGMVQNWRRCFAWHSGVGTTEVLRFSYWHSPARKATLENKI